jgi:cobalamin biosynthesis Mg chelatase CobN
VISLIALLALACVPALAQAECTDSSCKQYEVEIPTAGGKEGKPKKEREANEEPAAEASSNGGKNKEKTSSPAEADSKEAEEGKGAAPPGNGGNHGGGNGANQGKGGSSSGKGSEGLGGAKQVGGTETGKPASHSSGGSSPLVPILIAIAVLAAISIGAVIYRQRRQDGGGSGSPVSPKAG